MPRELRFVVGTYFHHWLLLIDISHQHKKVALPSFSPNIVESETQHQIMQTITLSQNLLLAYPTNH